MEPEELKERIPVSEFIFLTSRSSGPGGQNVNKVNTKVELRFNIRTSLFLTDEEKETVTTKLKRRVNSVGELIITSQSERTQLRNHQKVIEKFFIIVSEALKIKPERKPTRATIKSKAERFEEKRRRSIIKELRKDLGQRQDE